MFVRYIPPACTILDQRCNALVTTVGRSLYKYDLCTGKFFFAFEDIGPYDLSCSCLDEFQGRRLFVGSSTGNVFLINFTSGGIICSIQAHDKDVMCIGMRDHNTLYTGSLDGSIKKIEEMFSEFKVINSADNAMGDGSGKL